MRNQRYLNPNTAPHITTLVLIASLGSLSLTIFLASLPEMARYFDLPYSVMQLAISGYIALTSIAHLVLGPISDRYGRRPVMLTSIILFIAASIGATLTTSFEVFITFRVLQSVIVSGLVLSRTIVRDLVAREKAASMIGYVTMGMALAPMLAPPFGGYLAELFGWQSNFHFLSIFSIVVFVICWFDLGETNKNKTASFAAQIKAYPDLFKSRRFWGYALTAAFTAGTFFAYLGGAPFVGDQVFGLPPEILGVYFGAPAIGYMLGNYVSGRFSVRIGINRMVYWGTMINAAGIALNLALFYGGFGTAISFFGLMTFMGLGNGMTIPNATAGMLSVRPKLAGTASGLGGAIMLGGGAAMSALAGLLLNTETGAWPLLFMMAGTSAASVVVILLVIRRERQLGGLDVA